MKLSDYLIKNELEGRAKEVYEKLRFNFNIGTAVMKARIEKGWSQKELAERVGTKQANISNLESANSNPTLKLIKKVFKELDLEIHVYSITGSIPIKTDDGMISFSSTEEPILSWDQFSSRTPKTTVSEEVYR